MLIYWLIFFVFAGVAMLVTRQPAVAGAPAAERSTQGPGLAIAMLALCVIMGLRYRVGGDWPQYMFIYKRTAALPFERALEIGDPAYQLLNWSAAQLGGGIWLVNLVSAAIFCWGLHRFLRTQPNPWLGALVAFPYLIIVVGMGYTRQGVAIGIIMAGLASLARGGSVIRFVLYAVAAALFHRSALVSIPLVMFSGDRKLLYNLVVGVLATFMLYLALLQNDMDSFVRNYIDTAYDSSGAWIRVFMSLIPAAVLLLLRNRLGLASAEWQIWRNFALAAIAAALALAASPSSTAVDRVALYLLPLQVAILPRLAGSIFSEQFGRLLLVGYSAAVLFVWLNYAVHARLWLPYQFYPLAEQQPERRR